MTKIEAQRFLKAIKADKSPTVFVKGLIAEATRVMQTGEYWVREVP